MAVVVNNPVAGRLAANYGMFQDNNDQTNAGATSVNTMLLRTTDFANGISVVSNSRITMATGGIYNIQFSAQFTRSGGAGFSTVEVWLKQNGSNVAETNGQVNVPQSGGAALPSWNYLVQANSGDYFELCWSSTDTSVVMDYIAAGTDPARPETPSIIVTVTQVA
jgi:hypothetical protein